MRFLVVLITGILGATLGAFAGEYLAKLYRVSDFEGARGYVVVFLIVPLGFVVGALVGIWFARGVAGAPFAAVAKAQGMALLVTLVFGAVATGVGYAIADHAPKIDGEGLALEFEFRVPSSIAQPPFDSNRYSVMLRTSKRDDRMSEIFWDRIERNGDYAVIPGRAFLYATTFDRTLSLYIEGQSWHAFQPKVPARPTRENAGWSEWVRQLQQRTADGPIPDIGIELRYRVRPWPATPPSS